MADEVKTNETPAGNTASTTTTETKTEAPVPGTPEWRAAWAAQNSASLPKEFKRADGTVDMLKLAEAFRGEAKPVEQKVEAQPEAKADQKTDGKVDAEGFDANQILTSTEVKVDLWAKAREEASTGNVTAETRKSLKEKHGVNDEIIDNLVQATRLSKENHQRRLLEAAGSKELAVQALEYAKANYKGEQFVQFQKGINDPQLGPTVIRGLVAELQAKKPTSNQPVTNTSTNLLDNTPGGTTIGEEKITPFTTYQESQRMILDPRYQYDPKFRELYGKRVLATQAANGKR